MDSLGCITGDTGINKGGIIFIVTGANCFHPHTYINLHRLHSQPPYFGWVGTNQVRMTLQQAMPLVKGVKYDVQRKILREIPHFTFEKYFIGYKLLDALVEGGYGGSMAARGD